MSNGQPIAGNTRTFISGATLPAYSRVKLSGGSLVAAGLADEDEVGYTTEDSVSGEAVSVVLRSATGTQKVIAAGAIAVGAIVYTAADGEIDDTAASTSYKRGIALEAAAADQDIIEILPRWDETAVA